MPARQWRDIVATHSWPTTRLTALPIESIWTDISVTLRDSMLHWPGDRPVQIGRSAELERGAAANLSAISMGSHTGTHVDAPVHFLTGGEGIDAMPLDATIGPARVIESEDAHSIKPEELLRHKVRRGERILFRTRNSHRSWSEAAFNRDFVSVSQEAARFLADRGVRAVGIDYLSVGGFESGGTEVHKTLLEAGVWIIEGLDLSRVGPGAYYLVCLPLKVAGGDGAPARAVVRPLGARERSKGEARISKKG